MLIELVVLAVQVRPEHYKLEVRVVAPMVTKVDQVY
jgi:hypothetical protein